MTRWLDKCCPLSSRLLAEWPWRMQVGGGLEGRGGGGGRGQQEGEEENLNVQRLRDSLESIRRTRSSAVHLNIEKSSIHHNITEIFYSQHTTIFYVQSIFASLTHSLHCVRPL